MRPIDADELLAQVIGMEDGWFNPSPAYDYITLIKQQPTVTSEPCWISVKDRLPEKPGFYLCAVGASWMPVRIMEYRPYGMYENERLWVSVGAEVNHYVYDWFVHAWMPLPEPTEEET